jgi:TPR repeat protein
VHGVPTSPVVAAATCAAGDAGECARLDAACDHDDAAACEQRARALVGASLERNRRAYALHVRACHQGRGSACVEAGMLTRDGRGMDPNPERALALFVLGCNAGEARGCELEKVGGLDALVNARQARAACDRGASFACAALAHMYEQGLGVPADRGMAHRLHRKACDGRVEESCKAIGEPETPETLEAPHQ